VGEMADKMAARIAEEGGLDEPDGGAAPVPGTGTGGQDDPSAGTENADKGRQGPPESIPYSRFQSVNSQLNELKPYAQLAEYGIEADDALRLANFEATYVNDPRGTISSLIDSQQDLSEETKAAMKSLLAATPSAGAQGDDDEGKDEAALPADVRERLAYVDQLMQRDQQADSNARLDVVVRHWDGLDKQDDLEVPERTKLVYIQAAAGHEGYETLEQLGEAARAMYLEDRDATLGTVVQSRGTGTPRTVPGSGAAPAPPEKFKDFGAANKQILADIREGRLPIPDTMEG
jgi:hypothetical protein